jgi:hypothetical protein
MLRIRGLHIRVQYQMSNVSLHKHDVCHVFDIYKGLLVEFVSEREVRFR